jgi:4-hydroxy-3-methylbut-2-en-1-yl diphosphate synthase IspG/GcpE
MMLSGDTMRVSLTPDRLKSMEVCGWMDVVFQMLKVLSGI